MPLIQIYKNNKFTKQQLVQTPITETKTETKLNEIRPFKIHRFGSFRLHVVRVFRVALLWCVHCSGVTCDRATGFARRALSAGRDRVGASAAPVHAGFILQRH